MLRFTPNEERNALDSLRFPLLMMVLLAGCSTDPEKRMVGKWKADDSAEAVAFRAAKLKSDSPEADGTTVMAAARAMGQVALDLRADKTCELFMGGNKLLGNWALDKELQMVELDLQKAEIAPANAEKNPAEFKPAKWTAVLNEGGDRLDLFPADKGTTKSMKEMMKSMGKSFKGSAVLRK